MVDVKIEFVFMENLRVYKTLHKWFCSYETYWMYLQRNNILDLVSYIRIYDPVIKRNLTFSQREVMNHAPKNMIESITE